MPLLWDPRKDSAAYWVWFVAGSAFVEWTTEIILLRQQLRVAQSAPMPSVLQSSVTGEQYRTSAKRFEATYRTRTICATVRMIFVFMILYFDVLAVTWEWSQVLANQDTPGMRQIVMWLSTLALGCVPMRIPLYLSEQKLSQERETPKPKAFLSYVFDFPTLLAGVCLIVAGALHEKYLPGIIVPDFLVVTFFFGSIISTLFQSYLKHFDPGWLLESNLGRIHTVGALDIEKTSFPIITPFPLPFDIVDETIPEVAKLTPKEEEAIKQSERRPKFIIVIVETILLYVLFFGVLLIIVSPFLEVGKKGIPRAFGLASLGKARISGTHLQAVNAVLFMLILRPLFVLVNFFANLCEQKACLSGDSYVHVLTQRLCETMRKLGLGGNEKLQRRRQARHECDRSRWPLAAQSLCACAGQAALHTQCSAAE